MRAAEPDFSVRQLAAGGEKEINDIAGFFGLRYEIDENDKSQINHWLLTILIVPAVPARRILFGNEWAANDLLRVITGSNEMIPCRRYVNGKLSSS